MSPAIWERGAQSHQGSFLDTYPGFSGQRDPACSVDTIMGCQALQSLKLVCVILTGMILQRLSYHTVGLLWAGQSCHQLQALPFMDGLLTVAFMLLQNEGCQLCAESRQDKVFYGWGCVCVSVRACVCVCDHLSRATRVPSFVQGSLCDHVPGVRHLKCKSAYLPLTSHVPQPHPLQVRLLKT